MIEALGWGVVVVGCVIAVLVLLFYALLLFSFIHTLVHWLDGMPMPTRAELDAKKATEATE